MLDYEDFLHSVFCLASFTCIHLLPKVKLQIRTGKKVHQVNNIQEFGNY